MRTFRSGMGLKLVGLMQFPRAKSKTPEEMRAHALACVKKGVHDPSIPDEYYPIAHTGHGWHYADPDTFVAKKATRNEG